MGAAGRAGAPWAGQGFPLGVRSGDRGEGSPAAHATSRLPGSPGAGGRAAPAGAGGIRATSAAWAPALPLGADPQPRGGEAAGGRGAAPEAVQAAGQCGGGAESRGGDFESDPQSACSARPPPPRA